jgi:hypothetical protein
MAITREEYHRLGRELDEWLAVPPPEVKPKAVVIEVTERFAEAVRRNPESVKVMVTVGDVRFFEGPRSLDMIEVTTVDAQGKLSFGKRIPLRSAE